MIHHCDQCPHDLTVVEVWEKGVRLPDIPIANLTDDQLLCENECEVDGDTRRISSDSPGPRDNLRAEILRRMKGEAGVQL